jgi:hypothetical protein
MKSLNGLDQPPEFRTIFVHEDARRIGHDKLPDHLFQRHLTQGIFNPLGPRFLFFQDARSSISTK